MPRHSWVFAGHTGHFCWFSQVLAKLSNAQIQYKKITNNDENENVYILKIQSTNMPGEKEHVHQEYDVEITSYKVLDRG